MAEQEWPKIPVVAPGDKPEEFTGEVLDLTDEKNVDALLDFYKIILVPQLACATDGSHPAIPQKPWVTAEGRTAIVVRDINGVMRGSWIIKNNGIYYPCATIDNVALIFRELWDETIQHFDYLWGTTTNPVIMEFAAKAVRKTKTPGRPTLNGDKLEWRRPE